MSRGVLLDLDGTLADTERENAESVARALARHGRSMSTEEREYVIGHGWREIYRFLESNGATGYGFEELLAAATEEKVVLLKSDGLRELPGARAAVSRLAALGPVGVVTGSGREEAELVLDLLGARSWLKCLVAAEDVSRGKPSPDGYLLGAERLSLSPGSCIAVEDSTAGVRAARAAGMCCVAVKAGNFAGQDQSDAHAIIATLDDLDATLLDRLSPGALGGSG